MKSKGNIKDIYTLSPMQEGMLYHSLVDNNASIYFEQVAYRLHGQLDISVVYKNLNELLKRYDILRTVFIHEKQDRPLQVVLQEREMDFRYEDLRGIEDKEKFIKTFREEDRTRYFDLQKDVLIRVSVLQLSDTEYEFIWSHHHILMDGWCRGILISEFFEIYNSCLKGISYRLPEPVQYRTFIKWLEKQDKEASKNYWTNYLYQYEETAGVSKISLHKKNQNKYNREQVIWHIEKEKTLALHELAGGNNVTLNSVIQAVWGILLGRYNGKEDVVFGSVVSGRPSEIEGVESMIGLFINAVPVRIRFDAKTKFNDLLKRIQEKALDSEPHHHYPLAEIQSANVLKENLLDHIFIFENYPLANQLEGYGEKNAIGSTGISLKISHVEVFEQTNYHFNVVVSASDQLRIAFQYNGNAYDRDFLVRLAGHFSLAVDQVIENEQLEIRELRLLSGEEKNQVLYDFNDTASEYPVDKTIHQLFEEQVEKTPDNIALHGCMIAWMHGEEGSITYKELNEKSNQLTGLLIEKGAQPTTIVSIMMERSIDMIIGILGILKAGSAYLPIDSEYPKDRIDYMLKDSGAKLLVTTGNMAKEDEKVRRWEGEKNFEIVFLNTFSSAAILNPDFPDFLTSRPPNSHPLPITGHRQPATSLAYIIYTSGSTGKPKGVLIMHHNVARVVRNTNYIEIKPEDRVLQLSNYTFDGAVFDIYGALLNSSALVMLCREDVLDVDRLAKLIKRELVTVFFVTTALFNTLVDLRIDCFDRIRKVLFGGERVSVEHSRRALEYMGKGRIIHVYGPTETTVYSSYYFIDEVVENAATIPIGRPLANTSIYVLDRYVNLLPVGVQGEIYIGGEGTARGYLNNPELTAEKFVINSKLKTQNSILYKTGDLARWLADGDIEFQGRIDHQVKIRGFRVELGEIENRLLKHDRIKGTVVAVNEDETDDKSLTAYFVSDAVLAVTQLRDYLLKDLPHYMIPSYFVRLEKIPLTPNGKVDRKALPGPGLKVGESYTAPGNEIERKLVELWSEILGRDTLHASQLRTSIGIDDNFFELGGHSLKATILVSKIHKVFDVKVPLVEIFTMPRIKELAKYIKGKTKELYISIEPAEEKEYYELSPAQKRLYILHQLVTDNTSYNMPLVIPVEEKNVEKEKLESVFKKLIERHESLRTSFITVNEEPVQRIHRQVDFSIGCYEVTEESEAVPLISGFTKPFNLGAAPLLRVNLISVGLSRRVLFIDMHHIITDGTSQDILAKEFLALQEGKEFKPLRLHYKDYSERYNSILRLEAIKQQESYWMKKFSDELPTLNLPTSYPRPSIQSVEGNVVNFSLNGEETGVAKRIAAENDSTLYMFLLAVFNVLLSKLSGQEDIIIGTPIAARRHADLQDVIGMLVNTLAMRNYPSGDKPFRAFLKEVNRHTLDAYENQEYPFEMLVDNIIVNRDTSRNPVFDVMFNVLNQAEYKGNASEQNGQYPYRHKKGTSKFDMNLAAMEIGERLFFILEYSTRLFKPERIERIIGYFKNIVKVLSHDTGLKISEVEIIDKEEQEAVLRLSRGVEGDYERIETLHRWFAEQVERAPDNIAVIGQSVGMKHLHFLAKAKASPAPIIQLSYRKLNEMSNRLAYQLREKGVGPNSVVGLMVERSVEMITGILGIMKAGGAYLPIDSEYPAERKRYMLEDAEVRWLLVSDDLEDIGDEIINQLEVIDLRQEEIYRRRNGNLEYIGSGSDLVYVIYTSGSTGKPKGVMVEHRNLINLLKFQFKYTNIDCSRILQFSTISFDVSFQEIFSVFLSGGQLYLVNKETQTDIAGLFRLIERNGIKTVFLPISFLKVIFNEEENINRMPRCISHIQTAGEQVVISNNFRKYLRERKVYLHNHYGPSETHVVTTLTIDPEGKIPELPSIGKPVMNTRIYIVDKWGRLSPLGVVGEIRIGGVQIGRGYLNRPELTVEKFTMPSATRGSFEKPPLDPPKFLFNHHSPLYRTGDLARFLFDGNIEFLGRIDHQVKIRGFRVELGEIESRLLNYPGIKEVVVLAREEESGDKYICAYVVSDREYGISELRESLSKELPHYMIPSYFVPIEKIPLTPNRKIDRRALPNPELKVGESYVAPRDEIERKLVELWSEILGKDVLHASLLQTSMGIDDDFFELGGHSLKATILVSKIHKEFDVKVPLVELFKIPTIRGLSGLISRSAKDKYAAIEPAEKKEYYLLSSAQKRLFILQQMNLDSTAYNMPEIIPLTVEFDLGKIEIEETFKKLIVRHESLRSSFHMLNDIPVQVVHDEVEFEIEYYDMREVEVKVEEGEGTRGLAPLPEPAARSPQLVTSTIKNFIRQFDLSNAPLLRVGLLKTGEGGHLLLVDMHHIISDGVSHQVLVRDFLALYEGEELLPLPVQYKDFSQWQNGEKEKENLKRQEEYWLKEFEGEIPVLELPTDYPRPMEQSFEGNTLNFEIKEEQTRGLKAMTLSGGSTLYMVLVAVVNILLSKLSGMQEIIIGTPIAGRKHADLEKIIGMFVNTLSLRNYPVGDRSFREFLGDVKKRMLKVFENQEYPFEELVDKLPVKREIGRNPLFDFMFVLQNMNTILADQYRETEIASNPSVQTGSPKEYKTIFQTAKFDITLSAIERGRSLFLSFQYCTKLFKKETIERFITYFKKIVSVIVNEPGIMLSEIEIITEKEKSRILNDFNKTEAEYPKDKTVHRLFQEQAERTPGRVALVEPKKEERKRGSEEANKEEEPPGQFVNTLGSGHLSYGELNERSGKLAGLLIEKGVMPDNIVGIMGERSVEMIIGIMGILKAGSAYLPIEPGYPKDRIDYMVKDSGAKWLVTNDNLEEGKKNNGTTIYANIINIKVMEELPHLLASQLPGFYLSPAAGHRPPATSLAYVIYTSGTTGKPKGVLVEHRSLANLCCWHNTFYSVTSQDRATKYAGFSFDASVWEIFPYLVIGASIYIVPKEIILDIEALNGYYEKNGITISFLPTQMYEQFAALNNASLRVLLTGGDKLRKYIKRNYRLYNNYGPTENTVVTTSFSIMAVLGNIPIGKPVFNNRIYIMDLYRQLQPIGVSGELYVGGESLARGYLNNPELTFEKFYLRPGGSFRENRPLDPHKSFLLNDKQKFFHLTLYRTGDLARWLPDGNIEFLGRIDNQVKIRGFRVELGEIENRLLKHDRIKNTVVAVNEDETHNKSLTAYFVSDTMLAVTQLRDYLLKDLPDYMIPSYFVRLEKIPLTPSGKVDTRVLPGPGLQVGESYTAPGNEIEKKLVELWSELLNIKKDVISIDSGFFQLGGHSLKATILVSKIHKELNMKIPLAEVFKNPTIKGLSRYIESTRINRYAAIEPVEKKEYYPLSSAQKRLYFLQQFDMNGTGYNIPLILPMGKGLEKDGVQFALKQLIVRHESLRTSFVKVKEEVVQEIRAAETIHFSIDYYEADESRGQEIINHYIKPFDLAKAPLIRSGIIKFPGGRQILMVDIHHIVSDGTSHTILTGDFMSLYNGYKGNKGIVLEPLRIQYKDFAQWQNRLFECGEIKAQEEYWLELYRGEIPRLNLPTDDKRPEVFTFAGDHYLFDLEREDARRLKVLGSHYSGTLYMNMLAVLNTVFYKYTGQTDIIIGCGIAGRRHADLQGVVGMFVNTLVMRNYPAGEKSYEDFLQEVISSSVKGFENQDLQFEELVEQLEAQRDPSRNPLFDISMVVQNFRRQDDMDSSNRQMENAEVLPLPEENFPTIGFENKTSKFDMTFFVLETVDDVSINIEYYTGIFKTGTIRRLSRHIRKVIKVILENPSIKLKDIVIMSAEEKRQVLYEFNDTAQDYPRDKTIHEIFEGRAAKTPEHAALIYEDQMLTYKELDRQANRMARYLYGEKDGQPGKEEAVGIFMTQSLSRPISILGALKAGKGYIPIDSFLPLERIKFMINDSQTGTIISEKKFIKTLNRLQWECDCFCRYLCIDSFDIRGEEEEEKSELMNEELWQHVGETAVDEITGGGWLSSYTGEPLSREEMDEYGDNIFKKLEPLLQPRLRVLEIGCASGISMYRIAPRVGLYYGTDLSGVIINRNRQKIEEEGHRNIKLANLPAHEIHRLEEKNFDLIIMNSVIQCFHGHNYLGKVIKQCIAMLGETGHLFIGDIMDQDKKDALVRDLVDFKYTNRDKNYTTKTDLVTELFLSRGYWQDLELELKEIEKIEFSDKIYTVENELTRFRYDALVTVNKRQSGNKTRKKRKYQEDVRAISSFTGERLQVETLSGSLAYIIYTSGTTGKPKGVVIDHYSLVNLCSWYNRYYLLIPADRSTQYASFGFDASVWETFPALIGGAASYLIPEEIKLDLQALNDYLEKNDISISFLPTPICEQFMALDNRRLRVVMAGGDKLKIFIKRDYQLYNNYGPTENTVCATCCQVTEQAANISIGKPIFNNRIYIVDENGWSQAIGSPGEICLGGDGVARGYLNRPELTAEKFVIDSPSKFFPNDQYPMTNGRLYRTGDLGRWLPDGNIEFLGRIDHQIKIRGFRIESGEVENCLRRIENIKEVVVIDRADEKGDKYLAAYIVAGKTLETTGLRDFLSRSLPDYMIPSYFVFLEKIPLTPNGKIDRKALPIPEMQASENYTAPGDEIEKKLVEIWSGVLGIEKEKIGINDNFFHLGGHSLKATILISRIHRELDIKVPLAEVFRAPSVSELSEYIKSAIKDKYKRIEAVEKKEYYPVFSAQKRVYLSHHIDQGNVGYNQVNAVPLGKKIKIEKLKSSLKKLVHRHESLRTSFEMVKGQLVQRIHKDFSFDIEHFRLNKRTGNPGTSPLQLEELIVDFIKPFDLSEPPLIRIGLVETAKGEHILIFDIHHIITDGRSMEILTKDFIFLYNDKELFPMRLQFKDFANWYNRPQNKISIKEQEQFWTGRFRDKITLLNLPTDFKRPTVLTSEGDIVDFKLDSQTIGELGSLQIETNTTMFMVLIAIYSVFLAKITNQEDILVGVPIAGRRHSDLQQITGMFVNTLVMRSQPTKDKSFREFLRQMKEYALAAFENQEYQFENLVELVAVKRDAGRNPIFDTMFSYGHSDKKEKGDTELVTGQYGRKYKAALFDLSLEIIDQKDTLTCTFYYNLNLFKKRTILRLVHYFLGTIKAIMKRPGIKLGKIDILSKEEKQPFLEKINSTGEKYRRDKTVPGLFEEQTEKTPGQMALILKENHYTYGYINERSTRLAHFLASGRGIKSNSLTGLWVETSAWGFIGFLGILKAGAVYIPLERGTPPARLAFILEDSRCQRVLTESDDARRVTKGAAVELIDIEKASTPQPAVNVTALQNNCADLAGIYYAPGESKNPPGLLVEHHALLNSVESLKQTFKVNENWHYLVSNEICTMNFMIEPPDFSTGQSINSRKAVILDGSNHLLPPGTAGTVYIDGLRKQYGYLNRPGLTALRFIRSPFDESGQKTLFLTGKIGKYLDTGDIVLVEMKDEGAEQEERRVEPANEKEQKILAIWENILDRKIPGVTADFFQAGGSSIEALLLVTEINKTFKRQLSITDIYENESIRKQASLVEQTKEPDKGEKSARDKNIFRLKVGSRGSKNIFLIHDGTGEVDKYRLFCKELKSRDNYWGLPLKSAPASGLAPQELEIEDLASEHLTTIKQVQARGPYYLGGWSIGGLIAFEITRQLEQAGEHVDRLYMFDTAVPVKKTPSPQPFDLPGELELFNRFFQVPVTVTAGFKAANPEELWQEFLNFIENDGTYNQGYIVDKLAIYSELISDFGKLPAAELFKYVNRFRSTTSAGSKYYPGTKIKAKLHYYQAELSNQDAAKWQDFFTGKIDLRQTRGNHFNMFNRPHLQYLISLFEKHNHTG